MQALRKILSELVGLVVDDFGFALTVVVWIGLVWGAAQLLPPGGFWGAVLLFVGLGGALLECTTRRARGAR